MSDLTEERVVGMLQVPPRGHVSEDRTVVSIHKADRRIEIALGDEDWITLEMLHKGVDDALGILNGTGFSLPEVAVERIVWCRSQIIAAACAAKKDTA